MWIEWTWSFSPTRPINEYSHGCDLSTRQQQRQPQQQQLVQVQKNSFSSFLTPFTLLLRFLFGKNILPRALHFKCTTHLHYAVAGSMNWTHDTIFLFTASFFQYNFQMKKEEINLWENKINKIHLLLIKYLGSPFLYAINVPDKSNWQLNNCKQFTHQIDIKQFNFPRYPLQQPAITTKTPTTANVNKRNTTKTIANEFVVVNR